MTETPDNLVIHILQEIRADIARLDKRQEEVNLKVETLAGCMVSMNNSLEGLRADVRMIAIAVDGHVSRLGKIETTLEAFKH